MDSGEATASFTGMRYVQEEEEAGKTKPRGKDLAPNHHPIHFEESLLWLHSVMEATRARPVLPNLSLAVSQTTLHPATAPATSVKTPPASIGARKGSLNHPPPGGVEMQILQKERQQMSL